MEFNATLIVSAISFIVFIFIMNSILYQPILKIIEDRADFINSNIEEAMSVRSKVQAILDDKNQKIKNAHNIAKTTVSEGIENSNNNKSKEIDAALQRTREKIDEEKNQLFKDEHDAKGILKSNVSDLAKDISEKLLGQSVDNIDVDQKLVDEAMNND